MIVMKFGGTSVEDAASVRRVVEIVRGRLARRPVLVISAMGKTTKMLLAAAEASAAGQSDESLRMVEDVRKRHAAEARELTTGSNAEQVGKLLDSDFADLARLLDGLAILGEVPPRGLDKILAYGELLSTAIVAGALAERGIDARLLDSRDLIKTDDRYGSAAPMVDVTNQRLRDALNPLVGSDAIGTVVPVLQGFIGSTETGATTTLGFEGSDYTATLVGAAIDADDVEIWKDVPGMMTADPAVFSAARTVKHCSFDEAGELTYFGAKVLHPKAIYPAANRGISVHIYNSKDPSADGTSITAAPPQSATAIKSVAYLKPVTLVRTAVARAAAAAAGGPGAAQEVVPRVVDALTRQRLTALMTMVSGFNIVVAVDTRTLRDEGVLRALREDLSRIAPTDMEPGLGIVTVAGDGLARDRTVATRVMRSLPDVSPRAVLHGSSPLTLSVVVPEGDIPKVVRRLHDEFFADPDPAIFGRACA